MLKDKIAIVTGAGRGIGAAIATRLASQGAAVACVSRTEANARRSAEQVAALGARSLALAVDVADGAAAESAVGAVLKEFGRIDILVNNAGVTRDGLIMRMGDADWDAVLTTNLKGAFNFTRPAVRGMIKQRSGRIVNISSVVGLIGNAGQANYAASKAGLIGFTKAVAKEVAGRGVTCNAIAPGFITTDMTAALNEEQRSRLLGVIPLGRFGDPEDIAQAVLFLVAESGRYITGQVLTVDGGMVM
ncbi:MAG: 3-oxoacyl-[acyl-carrier-protein] reductase [Verrucomicrobiae bacterium]|nr:3-oxoacyl-[acyl-carrier-protein] reductase [Verrucomicrobiae bacterium]